MTDNTWDDDSLHPHYKSTIDKLRDDVIDKLDADFLRSVRNMQIDIVENLLNDKLTASMTASNQVQTPLTVAMLHAMMKSVRDLVGAFVDPVGIDLFDHSLDIDTMYEIGAQYGLSGRKICVVHKEKIDEIYKKMSKVGIDVRLKPRYGVIKNETKETD